jgi:hypothetical protein
MHRHAPSIPLLLAIALGPVAAIGCALDFDGAFAGNWVKNDAGSDAKADVVVGPDADAASEATTQTDTCGNGLDDDADGQVDEDCPCDEKDVIQPCYAGPAKLAGQGECVKGKQKCEQVGNDPSQLRWGACVGSVLPGAEQCNGKDDDCDGTTDNGCPCTEGDAKACSTACGTGQQKCVSTAWTECDAPQPQSETCNGNDDDCDGTVDNGAPCKSDESCVSGSCTPNCSPVAGGWGGWTCSGCSACGGGSFNCDRACDQPVPSCGGATCAGESHLEGDCSNMPPRPFALAGGSLVFDSCFDVVSAPVPAGITTLKLSVWGGGGGGGTPGNGGGGAFVRGTLPVQEGDVIELRVACGGAAPGGGGGASYVYKNGLPFMIAAGGGGAGSDGCDGCSGLASVGCGGCGGPTGGVGQPGVPNLDLGTGSGGGLGGSQVSGGAGGVSDDQSAYSGCAINGVAGQANKGGPNTTGACQTGTSAHNHWGGCPGGGNGSSGGGGDGYFGGGSGACKLTYTGGGGGGGSSWVHAVVGDVSSEAGAAAQPGGVSEAGYKGDSGRGGAGHSSSSPPPATTGFDGLIVLSAQ